jgi:hypothetical protein
MSVIFWKAKHNEVQKEVRGCGVELLIGVRPKHQLTLFRLGKPKMVLRSGTFPSFLTRKQRGLKILYSKPKDSVWYNNTTRLGYHPSPFRVG